MKTLSVVLGLTLACSALGQSSLDSWDSFFHPREHQARKQTQYDNWIASWKDRQCTLEDVKQYWWMTLAQTLPISIMDAQYYSILHQNQELRDALNSTLYDFEAQDIADQINIARLLEQGKATQADALEKLRLERRRLHEQEQYQAEMLARQQRIEAHLVALRQEVANLTVTAAQAAQAARLAYQAANQ
jgi:hypothetical protein